MDTDFVLGALEQAIWQRKHRDGGDLEGLVHHSDHGSQYLSIAYTGRLVDEGIEASAGAVGSSYDNAAAEALNKSYKRELVWRDGPWKDRDDLETATAQWVNRCQPHPTPPRQPRRPLTRRRRTPLPSQPHHHHRRPARHGTTNPPQNPGRSCKRKPRCLRRPVRGGPAAGSCAP